jgi:hypothetical protein
MFLSLAVFIAVASASVIEHHVLSGNLPKLHSRQSIQDRIQVRCASGFKSFRYL